MTINGKEFNGIVIESRHEISVAFNDSTTILDCAEIGESPVIVDNGKTFSYLGKILRIETTTDNGQVICTWSITSELDQVKEELAETKEELREKDSVLENIREAMSEIGTLPTLTKLMAFLNAVKEALNYGNNSDN